MIISPPFLPTRTSGQTESQWLDAAMNGWQPGSGSFPITGDTELWKGNHLLDWHGGVHLKAPSESGQVLPVRAIADGTVIFVRKPSEVNVQDINHPLNYGGGTTSDGVVVVRHDTEIGVDANDHPVEVRFYSIYMHLGTVETRVQQGKPIYRKDKIGAAGHIYGQPNMIHFEIRCDDDNLRRLVGRTDDQFDADVDGRSDVIFGEIYFKLPTGTLVYREEPAPNSVVALPKPQSVQPHHHGNHGHQQPAAANPSPPAPPAPLAPRYTSTQDLIVGLRYLHENVASNQQAGDALLTTYTLEGAVIDGAPGQGGRARFMREPSGEYQLYGRAMAISASYPDGHRPIPAAVYELLRFGRVIGPDVLQPTDVPHWRKIVYPDGEGWVNLNAANVRKFSDADFPPWAGWALVNDDCDGDSRCDSPSLANIVYGEPASASTHTADQARIQVRADRVQDAMSKAICKLPSEWDVTTLDQRWSWLKTATDVNPTPMREDEYADFKAHAQKLCFSGPELFQSQWAFDGYSFIGALRRLGWRSKRELVQCVPRRFVAEHHVSRTIYRSGIPRAQAERRVDALHLDLNNTMRKYLIETPLRQSVFLANAMVESGHFAQFYEGGRGAGHQYGVWYGRGIIQVTWEANYLAYFGFRGRDTSNAARNAQWRDKIETDPHERCESAGYWWAKNAANRVASQEAENVEWSISVCENFDWRARACVGVSTNETHLSHSTLDHAARLINTGSVTSTGRVNGLAERRDTFTHVQSVLCDLLYSDPNDARTLLTYPNFLRPQR